ncbi:unnamed protein product, partial [Ixodes pacificus]
SKGEPSLDVRHASEAHSRVQAATAQLPAHHHPVQPHQGQPLRPHGAPYHHDRRQGGTGLPHSEADHQTDHSGGQRGEQRPRGGGQAEGDLPGELPGQPGRKDHPCRRPERADLHRRHRGLWHRKHEVHAEWSTDHRHSGWSQRGDARGDGAREHLHLRHERGRGQRPGQVWVSAVFTPVTAQRPSCLGSCNWLREEPNCHNPSYGRIHWSWDHLDTSKSTLVASRKGKVCTLFVRYTFFQGLVVKRRNNAFGI